MHSNAALPHALAPRLGLLVTSTTAALVLLGCPNPNTYGTARTTPKSDVSHTISGEVLGAKVEGASGAVPMLPSYHLRYGVSNRVDMGFHLLNLSSLGFDFKVNFLRSDFVDLAIDPGLQTTWVPDVGDFADDSGRVFALYLHGPLLIDLNVSEALSFVLSPGVFWMALGTSEVDVDDADLSAVDSGLIARAGLGMDFRFSDHFAIFPEVTFLKPLDDDDVLLYTGGIGFNFGALPNFRPEPPDSER